MSKLTFFLCYYISRKFLDNNLIYSIIGDKLADINLGNSDLVDSNLGYRKLTDCILEDSKPSGRNFSDSNLAYINLAR